MALHNMERFHTDVQPIRDSKHSYLDILLHYHVDSDIEIRTYGSCRRNHYRSFLRSPAVHLLEGWKERCGRTQLGEKEGDRASNQPFLNRSTHGSPTLPTVLTADRDYRSIDKNEKGFESCSSSITQGLNFEFDHLVRSMLGLG